MFKMDPTEEGFVDKGLFYPQNQKTRATAVAVLAK